MQEINQILILEFRVLIKNIKRRKILEYNQPELLQHNIKVSLSIIPYINKVLSLKKHLLFNPMRLKG